MKQIIVLVATIILGIAIAAMVFSFKTPADTISKAAASNIEKTITQTAVE